MFKQSRRCHWCGVSLVFDWTTRIEPFRAGDIATVDHVYPKQHPYHAVFPNVTVIACWTCNQLRNQIAVEFAKIAAQERGNDA